MIKGLRLSKDSTIGILAPSSCSEDSRIYDCINSFKLLGFKIKYTNTIFNKFGYLAGTDKERAKDLTDMFLDPTIDGIFCFRGGYGSSRLIEHLNLDLIKNNFKFFCGYSDATALLNYFATNNLVSFHGPMVSSNFKADNLTLSSLKKLMLNPSKGYIYDLRDTKIINGKNFKGKILGGNLSVLVSTIGTSYFPNLDNSILLLEDVNEEIYSIDRMLTQLINSKSLDKCNGIILGHFTNCYKKHSFNFTLEELIKDRLKVLNIPIIYTMSFGHDYPNLTIPLGIEASYSIKNKNLVLCENSLF